MTWIYVLNYLLSIYGLRKVIKLINANIDVKLAKAPKSEIGLIQWYKYNCASNVKANLIEKIACELGLPVEKIAEDENIYLDWEEIDEMARDGFPFCSHTENHAPLNCFSNKECIANEIMPAFDLLKRRKQNVCFVSFPFGMKRDYGEHAVQVAFDAGHDYVVEVGNGTNNYNRVMKSKVLSRVSLGNVGEKESTLYSAIELRPLIKSALNRISFVNQARFRPVMLAE